MTQPRRTFVLGALTALPATALLPGCATDVKAAPAPLHGERRDRGPRGAGCEAIAERRARWLRLLETHVGSENLHDLPSIMQTFSPEAEMIFNRRPFLDPASIESGHVLFGMSSAPGALANTQVVPDREYFTEDEVLIEGRVIADHVGQVLQFPATNRRVEMHYSAFYRFDEDDQLVSERIVMDWAQLAGG